jgi:transposase InsO family protein
MVAPVLGMKRRAFDRWLQRRRIEKPRAERRPRSTVPEAARDAIRTRYLQSHRVWGPSVLAEWARREQIGTWSPSTIARVIEDLKPCEPKPPPPLRYEIVAANVMWSEDGAAFRWQGKKLELVVAQDEHSRFKTGYELAPGPATGEHVRAVLEGAFERYGAPLVLKRDGGAIFDSAEVRELLDEWGVTVVTSPPNYPRYNGKKERSIRDIKTFERACRPDQGRLERRIELAIDDLNQHRPRPVLGGNTAREVYERDRIELPDRHQFQQEVETEQARYETTAASRHEVAASRRKAVEAVLSRYGLIKWNADVSTYCTS